MSPEPKTAPRRLSDLAPKRNDDVLLAIENQEVTITAFELTERKGRNGTYEVAAITLSDGQTFTVAGSGVCGPLGWVEPDELPIDATFVRVESAFKPGTYYWTVQ